MGKATRSGGGWRWLGRRRGAWRKARREARRGSDTGWGRWAEAAEGA